MRDKSLNRAWLRILGILCLLFSLTMVPPLAIDLYYEEHTFAPFFVALCIMLALGLACWLPNRHEKKPLKTRDGFLVTVLFWIFCCFMGAIPFWLSENPPMSFTDAVFESISGITTTGATVLYHLDSLPHSILYYRQQLQLLGGLGIVILAIAILPLLRIGGMQLYRTEVTGPIKDNKLTPRIAETAKALWLIYLGLTTLCILFYHISGMPWFEAVCLGYSTMSTGGFAPSDSSFIHFGAAQKGIAIVFMILSATSFAHHFGFLSKRRIKGFYWTDSEFRAFIGMIIFLFTAILLFKLIHPLHLNVNLIDLFFQIVSFATTTGLVAVDYSGWPIAIPLLLLYGAVVGGCAGSTSGGFKMVRFMLLFQQGRREVHRLIHPHGLFVIKIGHKNIPDRVVDAVWGFFAVSAFLFGTFLLILLIFEPNFLTAYSALTATFFNIGPGMGGVTNHYHALHPASKWLLDIAMLAGRLEFFTLLVLLSPHFWAR